MNLKGKEFLTLLAIFFLAALLRFWQLGAIPPGLSWDEVSNGYNAYSILKTGRDEYGTFLPLSIRSYGDYNPPLSVYLLVPSVALFGLNEFAVRFPSAFLGSLTIPLAFFLVWQLFKRRDVAYPSALFLAISPWHLQFSRYDHEAVFALFFIVLAVYLFLRFLQGSTILLFVSLLSFALAFYSYQGAKFWVPLMILVVSIAYFKNLWKVKRFLIGGLVFFLVLIAPFFADFQRGLIRVQSVGILNKSQSTEELTGSFLNNYASHFSFDFLFFKGDQIGRHSVRKIGELYLFEMPLVIFGLIFLLRSKFPNRPFLLSWFLVAPIAASLAQPNPHALRSLIFLPTWQIFTALGTVSLFTWLKKSFRPSMFLAALVIFILVAAYSLALYLHIYYVHYPKDTAIDWQDGYRELFTFIRPKIGEYEEIAISNYWAKSYIYTLFFLSYDPATYQRIEKRADGFDKFTFFGPSWQKRVEGKALLVTPQWQAHTPKVLRAVYARGGELVFNISEQE